MAQVSQQLADSYRRIIDRVREANPDVRFFGVTATPKRSDRKGLREVFSNGADQIRIGELIVSGHLARSRSFVIDVSVQEALKKVSKTASDFDMSEVDAIVNKQPVTDTVIAHWTEKAGDRQTIVFCSTVDHAANVVMAFRAAGVAAALVHGEMASAERKQTLGAYDRREIQVIANVAMLTEGYVEPMP